MCPPLVVLSHAVDRAAFDARSRLDLDTALASRHELNAKACCVSPSDHTFPQRTVVIKCQCELVGDSN